MSQHHLSRTNTIKHQSEGGHAAHAVEFLRALTNSARLFVKRTVAADQMHALPIIHPRLTAGWPAGFQRALSDSM
jgi:hypothetical protein